MLLALKAFFLFGVMGAPVWAWMALAALLGFEAWLGQTKRVESNSTLALLAKLVPWLIQLLVGKFGALLRVLAALGKSPSILIVFMGLSLFGCSAAQQKKDADGLLRFEAEMKVDGAKAMSIMEQLAKDAPQIGECTVQAVAATAVAIASGNYLQLIGGYSCIPSAAKKIYDDVKAGLSMPPSSDKLAFAKALHDSITATVKTVAGIKAAASTPAPGPAPLWSPSAPAPAPLWSPSVPAPVK